MMIERTARKLHQHNFYIAEKLGLNGLRHQLNVANVNHCITVEYISRKLHSTHKMPARNIL